ncbi:MAG: hypothetical protein ACLPHP_12130 [Candidatus Sulfotelmatobacter sp.]
MHNVRRLSFAVLLLGLTSSCGSGSNRQLQSISISVSNNVGQYSFVATGTYNTSPITVTPLPASWYSQDPTGGYQLTTQPFVAPCVVPHGTTVTAMAPVDPHAPSTGSISSTPMVQASAALNCP